MPTFFLRRSFPGSFIVGACFVSLAGGTACAADSSVSDLVRARGEAKRLAVPLMKMDPIAWGREKTQGFHALFNGRNLEGWRESNSAYGQWRALAGAIRYTGGKPCWLRTETTHDNFVLRMQWRHLKSGGETGLFLRARRDGAPWPDGGLQLSMRDRQLSAGMVGSNPQPTGGKLYPAPRWNDLEITANEAQVVIKLNGKEVSRMNTSSYKVGFIGLRGNGAPFEARNVRIRELGWTPLYNGKDLSNWRADSSGHWTPVPNGVLAYDGKGLDLNTKEEFTNYDLRLDWKIGDPKADSGVLYRGSGFDKAQANIWNDPLGSGEDYGYRTDAAQPAAVRKAATPAKCADAPLGEWNRFDIRVRGRTVDLWLNGEHVIQNATFPGMPLKGPIGLQNHGSPVWFRNVEIRRVSATPAAPPKPSSAPARKPAGKPAPTRKPAPKKKT